MTLIYRYPLKPTRSQAAVLHHWLGVCCDLYNAALQERREAWRVARKNLYYYDQAKQLTQARRALPELAEMPAWPQRSALVRIDRAFKAFFSRLKRGEKAGYPRFLPRRRYRSFSFPAGAQDFADGRVRVPRLGAIRFNQTRELQGTPKEVYIGCGPDGWFVAVACVDVPAHIQPPTGRAIGIDCGLTNLVTTSDGAVLGALAPLKKIALGLRFAQRRVARRKRGSSRRLKAVHLLARRQSRLTRCIKYQLDVISKRLVAENDVICIEDLQIANMARGTNPRRSGLRRSIRLASWGRLRRMLTYKAESAGRQLVAVPAAGTSQECSGCGQVVPKTLSERQHVCACGLAIGRDHNAAVNVLQRGVQLLRREAGAVRPLQRPEKSCGMVA